MNQRNEKNRNAAESLSPELKGLLASTRPLESLDLKGMAEAARELDRSPEHIAETRKAAFVEDVLRALDEENIGKSELARRLGKTRQQLSYMLNEEKLNNFTIETMADIAAALGRHLLVRMLGPNERVQIEPAEVDFDIPPDETEAEQMAGNFLRELRDHPAAPRALEIVQESAAAYGVGKSEKTRRNTKRKSSPKRIER
jgi:transcriptional regulator with XRE-family HTH domain